MGRMVPAVERALDVLELFLDAPDDLSVPEITRRLDLPRTTVHELVATLVHRSYLVPVTAGSGRYRLGVRTYQLGSRYAERLDLATEGKQVAAEVAATCGETVHVAVLDGTEAVYVAKVDSTHAVRMVSAAGRRLPANCTAVGKMLLAELAEPVLADRLGSAGPLPGMTPNSITSVRELRQALGTVRAAGLAVEYCESNPDVACVAAPVRDIEGQVTAAMSISVPTIRWGDERRAELGRLITEGARQLSWRLGYRGEGRR